MNLQQKFFLVVSMLALALLGSLGAVWWAFGMLQRELATPFSETTALLESLRHVKRNVEEQSRLLHARGITTRTDRDAPGRWGEPIEFTPQPAEVQEFQRLSRDTLEQLAALDARDMVSTRIGISTWRNLQSRVRELETLSNAWFTQSDPGAQTRAADACFSIHELIERTEGQMLTSARSAVSYGDWVRARLLTWIGSVFTAGVLGSVLAVALLRRWVQTPVRALREAASRIARGDFQHRVPVLQRDELGLLSAEVNHMAEMVRVMQDERVDRERLAAVGEVMRRVVHNVRNPLAGIRGLAEVTRLDFQPGSPNRENMDMIVSTVDTFERWLSELLDATSPATIEPRETDLREWIRGIVEIHASQAAAHSVAIHLDDAHAPPTALIDPKHMDHALSALLSNAIEASPSPGDVWVDLHLADDDPTVWELVVADRGPGIPSDVLPRIFQPNFTTKRRGSGLGLAMAHQIVKGHAGRIGVVNSDPDHPERTGASFRLRLPLRPPQPARADPGIQTPPDRR